MVRLRKVASLLEGEWSCYRGGQFKWRENSSSYRGGQFDGGRMVMLRRWLSLMESSNDHVTDVVSLKEGEWLCYRRWSV